MFGTILISVCTLMHIYVFWRIASVPFVNRHVPLYLLIVTGVLLWAIFFIGRQFHHSGTGTLVATVELFGMLWMGTLFLLFIPLLAMDIISGFGFLMPRLAPSLRGWALFVGGVLSVIALFQGLRPPVVQSYDCTSVHSSGSSGWQRGSPRSGKSSPTCWSCSAMFLKVTAHPGKSCFLFCAGSQHPSASGR
jgi:hypothetical protein